MNINDIYTPLEEAKEEIKRRWEDKELRKKVEEFLDGDVPDFLSDSPKAHLVRHVSSPNLEFFRFKDLADQAGLEFILGEFIEDKFTTQNSSKYYVGRMFFDGGKGKKGGRKIFSKTVIDFNKAGGEELRKIKTLEGKLLVDLHHGMLTSEVKNIKHKIQDLSPWLKKRGEHPKDFYIYFLALFIRNGILFENLLMNDEEKDIVEEVIVPAIDKLYKIFNKKPLIVRLLPEDSEEDPLWYYYDDYFRKYVK